MKERLTALFFLLLALVTIWAIAKKQNVSHRTDYGNLTPGASRKDEPAPAVSDEVIRLHILADNDSALDQSIKLSVRDALLPYLSAISLTADSKEAALQQFSEQCPVLTEVANLTLRSLGAAYTASVTVTTEYFPIRIYGDAPYSSENAVLFPPGNYNSIRVTLGNGEGHNWWCLAYPSLCFIDASYEYIPKNTLPYQEAFATVKQSTLYELFYPGRVLPSSMAEPIASQKASQDAVIDAGEPTVRIFLKSRLFTLLKETLFSKKEILP